MRIVFLNAWHGKLDQALSLYLRQQASMTDIFCFQEADGDMLRLCAQILSEYDVYADTKVLSDANDFAQATYVRKGIPVVSSGTILKDHQQSGLGLYVEIKVAGKALFVCNFHGISRPVDKLDTPERILQSTTLLARFKKEELVIIGGDFNVFPETKSIQLFATSRYRDLISEYGITNTRNHYIWDRYPDNPRQYYSDYAFLSPTVRCLNFTVPDNEVSDHLPLELEIAI